VPFWTRTGALYSDLNKVSADMKDLLLPSLEVEQILDSNHHNEENRVLYLVQQKDYPNQKDWTQDPLEHFRNAMECLREFHVKNPNAARDDRVV
jgi:cysteinyl-tRNA synthetase